MPNKLSSRFASPPSLPCCSNLTTSMADTEPNRPVSGDLPWACALIEARNRKQQQHRRTERCTCLKNLQLELHRHPCKTGHAERTSCSRFSGGCRRGRHQKGRPSVQAMSHHEMSSRRFFFYKVQLGLRTRRNGRCTGSCPSSTIPIRIPMRSRKGDQSITTRPKHVTALFCERKFGEIRDAYEATHGALGRARDASCTSLHALPA